MKNREINLDVVAEIAVALGDLNKSIVFVGGAVVSVYVDDPAADEARPTEDIDLILTLIGIDQQTLDKNLSELGFHLDIQSHKICTYRYNDIAVDIMPALDTLRGPTNRWYQVGFDSLQTIEVEDIEIQVLSAPCFIATKFEAFNNRGQGDYRMSHDFEDIIYVVDNRTTIVNEIESAEESIQHFLKSEIQKILNNIHLDEIISAHLSRISDQDRSQMLLEKFEAIAS